MNYVIPGKGKASITKNDFISEGGEGKVYGKGDTAYKIYTDAKKAVPEAKIKELNVIDHPGVIKPVDPVLDKNGTCVGFTMPWIKKSVPLAKLFSSVFKTAQGVTSEKVMDLLEAMREAVVAVHAAGCLIVDANEFNFLVDDADFKTPYFIDVNSYQTPSFPATALLPSVRDFHSKEFSESTDWFGFGIIACRMFLGIHPYKGKHPKYTHKKMGGKLLEYRMRDNVSIFGGDVTLPPSAGDPDSVPPAYRKWFYDMFQQGKRRPPPHNVSPAVQKNIGTRTVYSGGKFEIKRLKTFGEEIVFHRTVHGREITRTVGRLYIDGRFLDADLTSNVIFTPERLTPVVCSISDERLDFNAPLSPGVSIRSPEIKAETIMIVNNVLWAHSRGKLIEFAFKEGTGGNILAAVKSVWDVMPNSSRMYDGLMVQNMLGRTYLTIPAASQNSGCHHVPLPELDKVRVIDAAHQNGVCMVMGFKNGEYRRFVIRFAPGYTSFSIRETLFHEVSALNFVTLDNGVAVSIPNDGVIEIFFSEFGNDRLDIIHDPDINSSMRLCKDGIIAKFHQNGDLYSIRMKK